MSGLSKIVYLTEEQYNKLADGQKVGNETGLDQNALYLTNAAGHADTANGVSISTDSNSLAYYINNKGIFGMLPTDAGALFSTGLNQKAQFGTLPIAQGGTGSTEIMSGRLIFSNQAQLITGNHYINDTKIAINSSDIQDENLYVNGTIKFDLGANDTTNERHFIINGNNRHLSIGASGIQAYNSSNVATTLNLQYYGGSLQIGQSSKTVTGTLHGTYDFKTEQGFKYSGIESASGDNARAIWFARLGSVGTPVYNENFTYNPSTTTINIGGGTLSNTNYSGTAAKATADASGNTITSTYAPLASPILTGTPTLRQADSTALITNNDNSNKLATTEFVMNRFRANDAMLFKGTIGASKDNPTTTSLPDTHDAGWTYRVITDGTYPIVDSNGKYCEEGTLIICTADGTSANPADWTSVETNEDGAVIGPTSSTDNAIVRWNGTTGRIIQNSSNASIDDSGNMAINSIKTTLISSETKIQFKTYTDNSTITTATFDGTSILPGTGDSVLSRNLGSSTYKWANVYATTFYGNLSGNATTSTWTTLLKPIADDTTASASTWNIPSGSYQVWGERFSDTRLKYTPSGGSESTVTDTGDWTMWLTSGGTTNTATLNMRIDGTYYGSFSGNLTGNATTATSTPLVQKYITANNTDALVQLRSNNKNGYIWQAGHAASATGGFSNNYALQYYGEGSSPDNYLILKASNSSTTTNAVKINENGLIILGNTTASTSATTGALVVNGGIATGAASYLTGSVHIVGPANEHPLIVRGISGCNAQGVRGDTVSSADQGLYLNLKGGPVFVGYADDENSANYLHIQYKYNATSTTTGALRVDGGAGVARDLYIGGSTSLGGQTTINYTTPASSTKGSSQLQICDSSTSAPVAAIELRRGAINNQNGKASWQIIDEAGELIFRTDYKASGQATTYNNEVMRLKYSTQGATINGILAATGGSFSGEVTLAKANNGSNFGIYVNHTNPNSDTTKAKKIALMVGGTSGSGGLYDSTKGKWIVYSNTDGNVTLNGNALTATTATSAGSATKSDVTGKGAHTATVATNEFSSILDVGTMTVVGNVSNTSMPKTNNANAELIVKAHPTSGSNYYEARLGFSGNGNLYHMPVNGNSWKIILDSNNYSSYAVAKTAGVTAVTWDATNKKLTRTINGTAADVMTAAQMSTALGLGTMVSETATNYLKWQTTSSASTALYNFGVYVAQNTAAGTGPNNSNYYNLINVPYRKASGNTKLDYGWQLGNTAYNDNRLYYRTTGDNTAGAWQTIVHVTTSANSTGGALQPVYINENGEATACTFKSLGGSHPNNFYSSTMTYTNSTTPTTDWYVQIELNRTWDVNLTNVILRANYSNHASTIYLNLNAQDGNWSCENAVYGGPNIKAIKAFMGSQADYNYHLLIQVKLAVPTAYNGSTPTGTITVYAPVNIISITKLDTAPTDLITLRRGYNTTMNVVADKFYGTLEGNAATASSVAWENISGRPTDLNEFNNNSGYVTSSSTTSTNNAIVRFNGTNGRIIQTSSISIDDNGYLKNVDRIYAKQNIDGFYFLSSSGTGIPGYFSRLGLNSKYSEVDLTNYVLDVNGKSHLNGQTIIHGQTIISGGTDAITATANSGYLLIGNPEGAHIVIDDNEIMSKATGTTTSNLFLQNDGGDMSFSATTNTTNQFYIRSTTASSSTTTGALRVGGGAGIAGKLYVGSTASFGDAITLANNRLNNIGDDIQLGDQNIAGTMCIKGKNGNTSIRFLPYNGSAFGDITWDGTKFSITSTTAINASISGNAATATKLTYTNISKMSDINDISATCIYAANSMTDPIDGMSTGTLLNVGGGNGYYRAWQIWNQRNDSLRWRTPLSDASGWGVIRVILDTGNTTIPNTIPTLSWGAEATILTINGSAVKVKAMAKPTAEDLPTATASALGVAKFGTGLSVSSGNVTLNVAKYNALGGLKPAYTTTKAVTLTTSANTNALSPTIQQRTTSQGRYYAIEADMNGVPFVNVPWTDTDTKVNYKLISDTTTQYYLMGSQNEPTSADVAVTAGGTTNAYIMGQGNLYAHTLHAETHIVNEHVSIEYNETDNCLDFVFQ